MRPVQEMPLPGSLGVLVVGGLGTPERTLEVAGGYVARLGRVHPAGAPCRYLLDDVHIAVGIVEGEKRPVARALGVGTGLACLDRERRAVPDVAHLDATADELVTRRLDVGDDDGGL